MKTYTPLILIAGFFLGWFSHSLFTQQVSQQQNPPTKHESFFDISVLGTVLDNKGNPEYESNRLSATPSTPPKPQAPQNITTVSAANPAPTVAEKTLFEKLSEYLNAENYVAAMGVFQEAEKISRDKVAKLKEILKTHLRSLLAAQRNAAFIELSDHYLALYYEDIDILLLLAEFNSNSNFYFDALSMYQLANEYAYTFEQKQRVREHYQKFISQLHTQLANQQDWYQLSQIYSQISTLGLLENQDKLKQAEVNIELGNHHNARQNLTALIQANQFAAEARNLLAKLDGSNKSIEASPNTFAKHIPLTKIGNQFTVPLTLGRYNTSTLLIDTGASLTTISKQAFENYERNLVFSELGSRMFNTANGLAKGRVVQLDSIELGGFQLENILIAVLDFDMHGNAEGLLGMNVLGRFKFQIDQQNSLLSVTPQ